MVADITTHATLSTSYTYLPEQQHHAQRLGSELEWSDEDGRHARCLVELRGVGRIHLVAEVVVFTGGDDLDEHRSHQLLEVYRLTGGGDDETSIYSLEVGGLYSSVELALQSRTARDVLAHAACEIYPLRNARGPAIDF